MTTAWTPEAVLAHLTDTFSTTAKQFPALLEPYEIMLADAHDDAARVEIMRRGLRETIKERVVRIETQLDERTQS